MSLYKHGQIPSDTPDLPRYLEQELPAIEQAINYKEFFSLEPTTVAPAKLNNREIRFADGTNWNPGSGRGYYWYDEVATAWKLLG